VLAGEIKEIQLKTEFGLKERNKKVLSQLNYERTFLYKLTTKIS